MDNLGIESETLEFKESTTELEKGIVSLTSMLNKNGFGEVLFGVRDNGDVIGQDIGKTTFRSISQAISNFVDPPIISTIERRVSSDGREYISVKATGRNRPYACRSIIYIRTGEEDRKVPMSELRVMFMTSADNLINSTSNNQELTFDGLIDILDESGSLQAIKDNIPRSLDLVNSEGKYNIQGQLLSDQNPTIIVVAIFSGIDRTVISHRTEFSGCNLLTQVRRSLEYVETLNEVSVDVGGGIRKERTLFDMNSVKEAWINACVHNNWLNATPPAIHIFDDRMEIISFGPKPYWLSEEDFFSGRSQPVNESLMRVFIRTKLAEHTGHGVPIVVEHYGRECYNISNTGIVVSISFSNKRVSAILRGEVIGLSDTERNVIEVLKVHPQYTLNDVAEVVGLSRSYVGKVVMRL
ncbi:MAG: RNA-binding domain-containing protein, partial [Candidatus Methanomethylophilaceae archaeon]